MFELTPRLPELDTQERWLRAIEIAAQCATPELDLNDPVQRLEHTRRCRAVAERISATWRRKNRI